MKLSRLVPLRRSPALFLSAVSACAMALIVACAGELPPELQHGKSGGGDTGGAPANTGGMDTSTGGMSGGGTGGMASGTGGTTVQNCSMAMQILTSNCSACHTSAIPMLGNLDLLSSGVASRLVDKPAATTDMCSGKGVLIQSNTNPAKGIFVDKITDAAGKCGSVMPQGGKLPQSQVDCLVQWATYLAAGNK